MPRKNRNPHPIRKPSLTDRYDLDYVNLPERPDLIRIIARPYKTIFVNLDAAPWATKTHMAQADTDQILRKILRRAGNEVIA